MRHSAPDRLATRQDSQAQGVLGRWLLEREDLTSRLCALANTLRRGPQHAPRKTQPELDRFCEVLVDYVSAGHFEIYRTLLEQHDRVGTAAEALELYELILPSTEAALDFNDRYFRSGHGLALARDLSALSQLLATRFDCEDALIRSLRPGARAQA